MSGDNSPGRRPRVHRLMLFGGGGAGTALARAAQASGKAEVVAICEPNPARRAELEQEFASARVSADYEALLRETRPTIADVASPDHLHTEHALAALEAGCDVLVEKPLAVSVEDAIRTIETAEREHAVLVVNYTLRYQYPTQEALEYALDGELGKPFLYQGYYVHDMWEMYSPDGERHTPWRIDARNPQNVLLGGGCHPIDLILTAADSPPIEVSAYANRLAGSDLPADDCYVVNIAFESGALANVLVTTRREWSVVHAGLFQRLRNERHDYQGHALPPGGGPREAGAAVARAWRRPQLAVGFSRGLSTRSTGFCRLPCLPKSRRST